MLQDSGYKYLLILCFSFSALLISGCQGCRDDSDKTAEEKKKEEEEREEEEKPSFETEAAVFYPGKYDNVIRKNLTKRGHWVSADFRITANKFDAQGELTATSSTPVSVVPVEHTDYFSVSKRPFSIPKGESKILSTSVFLPRRGKGISENVNFTMNRSAGGLPLVNELHSVRLMRSFQYHMVALTNRPDAYGYLNVIDSVMLPEDEMATRAPKFFTVVRTNPREEPISLPRDALNWTTISYLIWDDLAVDQLDEDQQQALVDWLYYGGQMIMSGPDCLDKMAGTFLEPHLPAKFAGTKNLLAEDFEELNKHWAVKVADQNLKREIVVNEKMPILGVEFDLHPDAKPVTNTGKIAVERQIGRGRIVITAFSLDERPMIRWPSFKSFFNGALLRRPGREFGVTSLESPSFAWITDKTTIFDPLIGSNLRYLSRDLVNPSRNSTEGTPEDAKILIEEISGFANVRSQQTNFGFANSTFEEERFRLKHAGKLELRNLDDHRRYGGFQHDKQSGVAGWNDKSGVSAAARESLKNAAGITPTNYYFVLRMLAVYLLVLVPVNWFVFWMIGRVEWAWVAAPLIAIGGAFTVAKMASLDIGFVRSNTQVACLEIYSDYPRAHVAQYSALYTSLSTGYDLELDNPTAQSLPLGDPDRRWEEATLSPVTLRRTLNRRLEGFQVQSNSTGMLHTEMMYDLGGVFSYRLKDSADGSDDAKGEVLNATGLELGLAAVVRRTEDGQLQGAWIGDLPADSQSDPIQFNPIQSVYDPWNSTTFLKKDPIIDQWAELRKYLIADSNGDSVLPVEKVVEVLPELQPRWDEFLQIAATHYSVSGTEELLKSNLNYSIFSRVMKDLNREESVTVRRIFQVIADNLAVAAGETRLIAVTKQSIGKNVFEPASTQTQQQTLVVVHLKRPDFEDAAPDINLLEDFTGATSNLDGDWDSDWDEDGDDEAAKDETEDESVTEDIEPKTGEEIETEDGK